MPNDKFVRVGKCVYKVLPSGKYKKKGCSDSVKGAEAYRKKLYQVQGEKYGKK